MYMYMDNISREIGRVLSLSPQVRCGCPTLFQHPAGAQGYIILHVYIYIYIYIEREREI